MNDWLYQHLYLVYFTPLLIFWWAHSLHKRKAFARATKIRDENIDAGLDQPTSLHPIIDPTICIGCGACVSACPEKNVLGLIAGKAELISPANCIGHGACKQSCPVGGIDLVFGTARRGIDIPLVKPNFESTVSGIYIAGELGGMGLVRNAIEQGKQAVAEIGKTKQQFSDNRLDLIIVGAGPAGIAAGLTALSLKLRFKILEQDSLGGTVAHFPRNKLVMTAPAILPLAGKMNFRETSKEALLKYWQDIVSKFQLEICSEQRVDAIDQTGEHAFRVTTSKDCFECSTVLLCVGRRGTPRKLNVPGEDSNKVVYRLVDARQYAGRHVLVVGGGDSALEAALALSEEPNTKVTLCYRSDAFSRAKEKNREHVRLARETGAINVYFQSEVKGIETDRVLLITPDGELFLPNDTVIVCAGGVLPTKFLQSIGVHVETKYGTA